MLTPKERAEKIIRVISEVGYGVSDAVEFISSQIEEAIREGIEAHYSDPKVIDFKQAAIVHLSKAMFDEGFAAARERAAEIVTEVSSHQKVLKEILLGRATRIRAIIPPSCGEPNK